MREAVANYLDGRAPITSMEECRRLSRLWKRGQVCVVPVDPLSNRELCGRLGISGPASVFGTIDDAAYHDFAMDVAVANIPVRIRGILLTDMQRSPVSDGWWMNGLGLHQDLIERHFGAKP